MTICIFHGQSRILLRELGLHVIMWRLHGLMLQQEWATQVRIFVKCQAVQESVNG